jgi:hypothetical protein
MTRLGMTKITVMTVGRRHDGREESMMEGKKNHL